MAGYYNVQEFLADSQVPRRTLSTLSPLPLPTERAFVYSDFLPKSRLIFQTVVIWKVVPIKM